MPSSWNVYYVIFLSAVLALGIPATLAFVSFVALPRQQRKKARHDALVEATEGAVLNQTILGKRINARFFMGVNASLVLITLMLALIPCAGMIRAGAEPIGLLRATVAVVTLGAFAALGLFYSARKGDLSWLRTHQDDERRESSG